MRATLLASLLAVPVALAVPTSDLQTVLGELGDLADLSGGIFNEVTKGFEHVVDDAEKIFHKGQEKVQQWFQDGKEFVKQNGLVYELVTHSEFSDYQLRVTDPEICDPTVKQHSGYLDITDGKHLFFWFFESRRAPEKAPLILWLNGGPGCSSSNGMLMELGPCNIADDGKNTTWNKYSWNTHANIIFLDQPVDVGFSYSDDGSTVNNSPAAAEDVYAFLELFLNRYPEYANAPFHLAAESYGGTYAPHMANLIHAKNQELVMRPNPQFKIINLASVILANGITNPYEQFATVPDYACNGPYPVYDDPEGAQCQALRTKVPTCQRLVQACYSFHSRWTCVPAQAYCYSQLFGPLQQLGLNLYDVRKKCDKSKDGDLCYRQTKWIETWMNDAKNKKAVGANPDITYAACNMELNQAFFGQGDGVRNSAALLTPLINDDIKLLVYAGNADIMCNYMGNEAWVSKLEHKFHDEFERSVPAKWVTLETGRVAGEVRSAGGDGFTAGNVTFVQVYEAGHMVPFDQPEAALDLITRWITDVPLSLNITGIVKSSPFGGL